MAFDVGDVVKIRRDDLLRGGGLAKVMQVLPPRQEASTIREYVVEFQTPPQKFPNSERFRFCIYREEQLNS
jgi:hypothetical protein